MLVEAPYVILYETHPDNDDEDVQTVEIVRVLDGRRDLDSLFQAPASSGDAAVRFDAIGCGIICRTQHVDARAPFR